jgi:hypothetical protein
VAKPTADEQVWYEAAQQLTPEKSLERSQTLATFVFTNATIVATILAGLGIVADKTAALKSAPRIGDYPLPVLLVGISLFSASVAVWPKLTRLNPNRIDEVKDWYTGQIRRRGIAVSVALVALSAAIVLATLSFTAPALNTVAISAAVEKSEKVTVKATVEFGGASTSAVARTTIDHKPASGPIDRVYEATSRADASGTIKVEAAIAGVAPGGSFVVTATVMEGDEEVAKETVAIPA